MNGAEDNLCRAAYRALWCDVGWALTRSDPIPERIAILMHDTSFADSPLGTALLKLADDFASPEVH